QKKIPVSGPIFQTYARQIAQELGDKSGFKASNGWLKRFRVRYNVHFRMISGKGAAVNQDTVIYWKTRLSTILEQYNPVDVYKCDETSLYYKLMSDRSLIVNKDDCIAGKKSKERFTVLFCANWTGNDKLNSVVIGKAAKPRCFRNLDMKKLPVTWYSNRTAWMYSSIFTDWLHGLDLMMQKQKRRILLFLDNAPLVHHIIISATNAYSADDVVITALDAICWIDIAWKSITEITLQNTFRKAGFIIPSVSPDLPLTETTLTDEITSVQEQESLNNLDKILEHIFIGGTGMPAIDFVGVDDNLPAFNEWNDNSKKLLSINVVSNEDTPQNEDFEIEQPPSLPEAIKLLRRLKLLSTTHHPELHQLLSQL
ncbi:unnamed protein product, partial [Rotaria sp. Silwood2]